MIVDANYGILKSSIWIIITIVLVMLMCTKTSLWHRLGFVLFAGEGIRAERKVCEDKHNISTLVHINKAVPCDFFVMVSYRYYGL